MRIGELADRAGVTTKTLRFYEQAGVLPPPDRTSAGYRDDDETVLDVLRFVRAARAAGLTSLRCATSSPYAAATCCPASTSWSCSTAMLGSSTSTSRSCSSREPRWSDCASGPRPSIAGSAPSQRCATSSRRQRRCGLRVEVEHVGRLDARPRSRTGDRCRRRAPQPAQRAASLCARSRRSGSRSALRTAARAGPPRRVPGRPPASG